MARPRAQRSRLQALSLYAVGARLMALSRQHAASLPHCRSKRGELPEGAFVSICQRVNIAAGGTWRKGACHRAQGFMAAF